MTSTGNNIYFKILESQENSTNPVLATVVDVKGAAPQIPGSSALFGLGGLQAGTIGGGVVEYRVQIKSKELLNTGKPVLESFDLMNEITEKSEAICGGEMTILMDAFPGKHLQVWKQLCTDISEHIPGILVTLIEMDVSGGCDVNRFWVNKSNLSGVGRRLPSFLLPILEEMTHSGTKGETRFISLHENLPGNKYFAYLEKVIPAPRLIIAGAGHVGKAVSHLGKFLGFEVTVWDDRPELANKENISDADFFLTGSVEESIRQMQVLENDYLVIVTRGHQYDAEVLKYWIKSEAAYVGMMGSRNKIAQVRQKFIDEGLATSEQWNKIYTPIGLPVGAKTVEEIAVSIASQLIQIKRGVNLEYQTKG